MIICLANEFLFRILEKLIRAFIKRILILHRMHLHLADKATVRTQ